MQSFVNCTYSEISKLLKDNDVSHFSRLINTFSNGILGNNDVTSNDTNTSSLSFYFKFFYEFH